VHNIEEMVHNIERYINDDQYSNGELAKYKKMIKDSNTTRKLVYYHGSHYNVKFLVRIGMCYCYQTYKWLRYVDSITKNIFHYHSQLNLLHELGGLQ
jgi:hypothetical protein